MQPAASENGPPTDQRLLRIDPRDNVFTVTSTLEPGEMICVEGKGVRVEKRLPLGHKVAAGDIAAGAKVIKYGVAIGSAIVPIAPGEHVHTHNLKSDYLPTYLHETQQVYFQEHH